MGARWMALIAVAAALLALAGCQDQMDMSGDGRHVAVSHGGAVWVASVDDENWVKVSGEGESANSPVWSPDGRYLLFQTGRSEPDGQQGADANATVVRAHTAVFDKSTGQTTDLGTDIDPPFAWTEDGQRFVAVHAADGGSDIGWYKLDGSMDESIRVPKHISVAGPLVTLPGEEGAAFAGLAEAASADGTPAYECGLYRTHAGEVERLAAPDQLLGVAYSDRLGRLLWAEADFAGGGNSVSVYRYDPVNGNRERLALPSTLLFLPPVRLALSRNVTPSVASVTFSPNGERLALVVEYNRTGGGAEEETLAACFWMEMDGSSACLIRGPEPGAQFVPAWSRDGQRLALLDNGEDQPRLFIYNADGTGKRMAALPSDEG